MSEQDCRSCKNWRECKLPPEWFDYSQIRWCPYQVLWLCQYAETLRLGRWPDDIYDDNDTDSQYKSHASFVNSEIIIAELDDRIEKTGTQGKLLMAQAESGRTIDMLDKEAYEALMFVKGWRRKRQTFRQWKKDRNYRKKHTN